MGESLISYPANAANDDSHYKTKFQKWEKHFDLSDFSLQNSDEDFLYIYATSQNELNSFIQTNHQLQYKEDGIDHNFVSIHTFIRNIINGDSTINFEVVHSEELKNTWLFFLHELKKSFNTYTIARSYLGIARRDCKHWHKAETDYDKRKKLMHIVRGYLYALNLISNEFNFNDINLDIQTMYNTIEVSKNNVEYYSKQIDALRTLLNTKLNNNTLGLAKIMAVKDGGNLNFAFNLFLQHKEFKTKQLILKDFHMSIFINALENWVSYEK